MAQSSPMTILHQIYHSDEKYKKFATRKKVYANLSHLNLRHLLTCYWCDFASREHLRNRLVGGGGGEGGGSGGGGGFAAYRARTYIK